MNFKLNESNQKIEQCVKARAIAFYLPQYHPIPENDEWWEKGFTEWTNVTKARPLFKGHLQPNLPADLGFYDLRVPEVREAQAELARTYGIEGFCYWHYWFGNGRRLLERPFSEVLETGRPDFPFCLAWANHTWSGIWHGSPEKTLIRQEYPGEQDHIYHFYEILPALRDKRYIRVNNKPLFVIYMPHEIPDLQKFLNLWNSLGIKEGVGELYFVGITGLAQVIDKIDIGLDAVTSSPPGDQIGAILNRRTLLDQRIDRVRSILSFGHQRPRRYNYLDYIAHTIPPGNFIPNFIPSVIPNWDNTPRSKYNGVVLEGANPESFKVAMDAAVGYVSNPDHENNIVFIKSWNEWAEGNYVEPDRQFGMKWLEAIRDSII
jgi:hypothetical protein